MVALQRERVCRVVRTLLAARHPGAPLAYTSSAVPLTGLELVGDLLVPDVTVARVHV